MNKYSRQLRIGRVFVCSASSGRKYAILADFTQCFVTQCLTLFCRLLSPFLRCRTGFFTLRKSPFHVAIWYVRHRHTGNLAVRKSLFRRHIFPRPSTLKTPPRHPIFRSLTHIYHHIRSSFPISRCQYFLLLKTYKYAFLHLLTLSPPHSLTSSLFPFYLFNFYPFTFKNSYFPFTVLPFYSFNFYIFPFLFFPSYC